MSQRPLVRFRPDLELIESRLLLSAGGLARAARAGQVVAARNAKPVIPPPPGEGFLAFRVTQKSYSLVPPFQQVLVQDQQPVTGQTYNVLFIALQNQTPYTFDASSEFTVRLNNQSRAHAYPILTGSQQWKPDEVFLFYVVTKKYYPVSFASGGFQFNLGGRSSTLVPGPSGILLRIKYDPANIARILDWAATSGPGAQGGKGPRFGLPDTAINAFVSARQHRLDFGGHF